MARRKVKTSQSAVIMKYGQRLIIFDMDLIWIIFWIGILNMWRFFAFLEGKLNNENNIFKYISRINVQNY